MEGSSGATESPLTFSNTDASGARSPTRSRRGTTTSSGSSCGYLEAPCSPGVTLPQHRLSSLQAEDFPIASMETGTC
ncbi:hypothetical protein STCU_11424 [Strigomonas culicis]|uniref:Uncharacterized protein n=1 Tax=Strigomonas culicis TaxID=28005 RepID=S9TE17_9TRYP|nr:hypothetical protein STCU_11424 [Strigomonas culicis]|eukprot:EPY16282.1 hypothetical protein STCU_11424 [Strigomonas culicis]